MPGLEGIESRKLLIRQVHIDEAGWSKQHHETDWLITALNHEIIWDPHFVDTSSSIDVSDGCLSPGNLI